MSKDEFLVWLFCNINEKNDVSEFAERFLLKILGIEYSNQNIELLDISLQWNKVDVLIKVAINSEIYCLLIEDKTKSNVHKEGSSKMSRLDKYYNAVYSCYKDKNLKKEEEKVDLNNIKCLIYKTSLLTYDDINLIKKAKCKWSAYNIIKIYKIFSEIKSEINAPITNNIWCDYYSNLQYAYDVLLDENPNIRDWVVWYDYYVNLFWKRLLREVAYNLKDLFWCFVDYYHGTYLQLTVYNKKNDKKIPCVVFLPRQFTSENDTRRIHYLIEGYSMREDKDNKNIYFTKENVLFW